MKKDNDFNGLNNSIKELVLAHQKLAEKAVVQYSSCVEFIISSQCKDFMHIERCLDGLLDFCFDENILQLFKKLCRYYYDLNPQATADYINYYREMWDNDKQQ